MKLLILYGTHYGYTEKIAHFLADEFRLGGYLVDVYDCTKTPLDIHLTSYDAYILGASVKKGQYPEAFRFWVKNNLWEFQGKHTAFFSVCLGILQGGNFKVQQEEEKIVKDFLAWSNWRPAMWVIFAGALSYSKYNWFLKRFMRSIARRAGVETEIGRDYEYTNWQEVRAFALEFQKQQMAKRGVDILQLAPQESVTR
jgi:menaquinone-dependent protoporphyrinogen oxidase